ncbi:iron-containing alcohol dehydrogenase [Desulfosediminicola flagellatus]|uniref:iron-containing alcohol dehydrogenase n=1 Tax=Desulfosediminicola flagellatus TaxID=2569541 RepID=UPI0010AD48DE|nr:iron-containing alcohol dehydrogenase [Desulfosediminicola flagellatus]
MQFDYHIPTRILFGPGKLDQLATENLPGKKALIVITGGKSMKANGYLERVEKLLAAADVQSVVFDKILPNPIRQHVMEGAEMARKEQCDFIIGLGGGSSIDSAKSIAVMAKNDGDYWDYIGGGTGKGQPVTGGVLPIVAITTTAGTGTEADPWTVITHEERNEKIGFGIAETFPVLSIVDPELMLTVPPMLTAYQGFDAFFHAAEGVIANIATPVSDIYALKSIELINNWLPIAFKDGSNLEARTNIALANTLSGFVESTSSCTSEHSLEHALSAYYPELPHGAGLIMLSQAYFSFFADKAPERLILMAKAMGKSLDGVEPAKQPYLFVEALAELQQKCGVDNLKMSDYGIKKEDIPKFAQNAFDTMGFLFTLDRYTMNLDDAISIITKAYK